MINKPTSLSIYFPYINFQGNEILSSQFDYMQPYLTYMNDVVGKVNENMLLPLINKLAPFKFMNKLYTTRLCYK